MIFKSTTYIVQYKKVDNVDGKILVSWVNVENGKIDSLQYAKKIKKSIGPRARIIKVETKKTILK